jgi:hypothetical protein
MDAALRAGIAVYNAGHQHAAHDAWEAAWLDLPRDSDDARFLQGLIQFTAAVHHARNRNWDGAVGLCESGEAYLAGLAADYQDVNVGEVRKCLRALRDDPERIERREPLLLTYDGDALGFEGLDAPASVAAAGLLGDALGYDEETFERAVEYAEEGLADGELNEFGVLLSDFLTERERRRLIATRLDQHVQRRTRREDDVAGLFD